MYKTDIRICGGMWDGLCRGEKSAKKVSPKEQLVFGDGWCFLHDYDFGMLAHVTVERGGAGTRVARVVIPCEHLYSFRVRHRVEQILRHFVSDEMHIGSERNRLYTHFRFLHGGLEKRFQLGSALTLIVDIKDDCIVFSVGGIDGELCRVDCKGGWQGENK